MSVSLPAWLPSHGRTMRGSHNGDSLRHPPSLRPCLSLTLSPSAALSSSLSPHAAPSPSLSLTVLTESLYLPTRETSVAVVILSDRLASITIDLPAAPPLSDPIGKSSLFLSISLPLQSLLPFDSPSLSNRLASITVDLLAPPLSDPSFRPDRQELPLPLHLPSPLAPAPPPAQLPYPLPLPLHLPSPLGPAPAQHPFPSPSSSPSSFPSRPGSGSASLPLSMNLPPGLNR